MTLRVGSEKTLLQGALPKTNVFGVQIDVLQDLYVLEAQKLKEKYSPIPIGFLMRRLLINEKYAELLLKIILKDPNDSAS